MIAQPHRDMNANVVYLLLLAVLVLPVVPGFAGDGVTLLSHLAARTALLPPAELLQPLVDGGDATKGMNPAAERALLSALRTAGLRERILRVAVSDDGGTPMCLVKVQAGDAQSRLFSLACVEQDALQTLQTAFSSPLQIQHVDFWAVLPRLMPDGAAVHRTVFSVAAQREVYTRLIYGPPRPPRELLASLSAVRYDPLFTEHAVDWAAARTAMPRTAFTFPMLAEQWGSLIREAAGVTPHLRRGGGQVTMMLGGAPSDHRVALTIDDGPHPVVTPLFLDVLRREKVKATFFLVGEKAEEFPGLVREIARDGHEIGNHTYSHRRFASLSAEEIYAEVRACSRIIGMLTGEPPVHLRPPGGDFTETALLVAESLGLTTSLWTHNTGDWRRPTPTAIAYNATRELSSGDIILMHQGSLESVRALPLIISGVRSRGLQPARLADLVQRGTPRRMSLAEAMAQRARLSLSE